MPLRIDGVPAELAVAISEGIRNGAWIRACCPWCSTGPSDRSIAARYDDPSDWRCFRCHREQELRDGKRRHRADNARKVALRDEAAKKRAAAIDLLEQCVPVRRGDPVDLYLRARQLVPPGPGDAWPSSLLLHRRLWHPRARAHFAAMVAVVTDVGGMRCAAHRTYLTQDGRKALVRPVKMALGPIRGCAIRLGHGPRIIVAEGIESALAAAAYHADAGLAPWSAISAGGIETLAIPREVTRIVVARDRGKAGRNAAIKLRARVRALEIEQQRIIHFQVYCPARDREDFADF